MATPSVNRIDSMCWNGTRVAAEQQGDAEPGGEDRHPGRDAGRDDDQAERGDAEAGHDRRGDDLAGGSSDGNM